MKGPHVLGFGVYPVPPIRLPAGVPHAWQRTTMTKILLVDDQPVLVTLMSEFLSGEGYDVTTHTDGLTALQQMLEVRPDLVITDLSMPGMDGGALLTAMRENAYLGDTPVLVLSGRPQAEIAAVCEGRGVIVRPFQGDGVRVTIGTPEENDAFLAAAEVAVEQLG